jgi:hypothetical protein
VLSHEIPSQYGVTHTVSSLATEFYNPKAFFTHAASLRQGFPHCARFPTAASRRSLDRVSVPVWLATLSGQLPVVALVSRYLTNKLMGRRPILRRDKSPFPLSAEASRTYTVLAPLSQSYPLPQGRLSTCYAPVRRCTHDRSHFLARLACVKRAASVRSEPGSNPPDILK